MWIALELVFHSYGPDEIEPGTLYMNLLYVGTDKELVEVFALDKNTANLLKTSKFINWQAINSQVMLFGTGTGVLPTIMSG